jgi:hypothetical protein
MIIQGKIESFKNEKRRFMYDLKNVVMCVIGILSLNLFSASVLAGDDDNRKYVLDIDGKHPKPVVAVKDVCAWPNLTLLEDGTIVATIHNNPSHLKQPADVDCWASKDGGSTWEKRGTPAPRDNERVARGNVAAGVANNGDLIVISSGWSDPTSENRGSLLPLLTSRSTDGGRTWTIDANAFPEELPQLTDTAAAPGGHLVPFGDILRGGDGGLRVGLYSASGVAFVYCSRDDGKTWGEPVTLNKDAVIHEPAVFHLRNGKWLAAARLDGLDLYRSDDDATTWEFQEKLTGRQQHPAHFVRLDNGRVLLTYGNRLKPKGVDVRFSDDEGKSWSDPFRVADFQGDGGYPSSVLLPDGQVLTAYYAQSIAGYSGYHMGVVVWDPKVTKSK